MKYLITENLIPGGLKAHKTRSCVKEIPEGQTVPEGAIETTEDIRDLEIDEPKETE